MAVKWATDTRFLGVERWPAVRLLVAIEHPKACDALVGIALARDAWDWLKLEAAGLLARMGDPNAEEALEALARRPRGDKRVEAVETLAEYRPGRVPDLMVAIAVGCYDSADRDTDTGERLWQSTVWRRLAAPVAVSVLKGLALDPHFGYFETRPRERAVKTLSCLPGSESTAALAELASAAAWEQVGTNVRETLWSGVTGSAALDADHRARDTTFWLPVRLLAAQSLHERGAVEAADALARVALNEREDGHSSRYQAALALGELGDPRAAGALESASPPPVFGRSPHMPPLGHRRRRRRG